MALNICLQEQSQRTDIYDKLPQSCVRHFPQILDALFFLCDLMSIYVGALMPYGLISTSASLSSWGWAEEWPDRAACQIGGINSQPFPPSSVIGCLLPSDLIIIQAVQIGLANEGPWSSFSWLLKLGPLLLSSAAVKLDIQPKPVISLSASVVNRERGRESDLPRATHPILNKTAEIGRY